MSHDNVPCGTRTCLMNLVVAQMQLWRDVKIWIGFCTKSWAIHYNLSGPSLGNRRAAINKAESPLWSMRFSHSIIYTSSNTKNILHLSLIPGTQKIWMKTWGCSHNNSDGEYMAGQLAASGYKITGKMMVLLTMEVYDEEIKVEFYYE